MIPITTGEKSAAVLIFLLAPLTGVLFGDWVAALIVLAAGAVVGLLATAGVLAKANDEAARQRIRVREGVREELDDAGNPW
jgi:hypothetical protein